MKVDFNTKENHIRFGAIPLYRATLSQKRFLKQAHPIQAVVTQFEKSDLNREGLESGRWFITSFGEEILEAMNEKIFYHWEDPIKFLLTEIPSVPEKNRIAAMASYFISDNKLNLNVLQSKSEFSLFDRVKGAGSIIMYALSKIAQKKRGVE